MKKWLGMISLVIASILFSVSAYAYTNKLAENKDILVVASIPQILGYFIGDPVPITLIIYYKEKGIMVNLNRIPKFGMLGDFEISKCKIYKKKDRVEIHYNLQCFLPPQLTPTPEIPEIGIWYSAKKYWSAKDERYIYVSLKTKSTGIYMGMIDPQGITSQDVANVRPWDPIFMLQENKPLPWKEFIGFGLGILLFLVFIDIRLLIVNRKKKLLTMSKEGFFQGIFDPVETAKFLRTVLRDYSIEEKNLSKRIDEIIYAEKPITNTELKILVEDVYRRRNRK